MILKYKVNHGEIKKSTKKDYIPFNLIANSPLIGFVIFSYQMSAKTIETLLCCWRILRTCIIIPICKMQLLKAAATLHAKYILWRKASRVSLSNGRKFISTTWTLCFAGSFLFLFQRYVVHLPWVLDGKSNEPTFNDGDIVLVSNVLSNINLLNGHFYMISSHELVFSYHLI